MKKLSERYPVDRESEVWCVVCKTVRPKDRKWKYGGKVRTQAPTNLKNIVHHECGKMGVLFYRFEVESEKEKVKYVSEGWLSALRRFFWD